MELNPSSAALFPPAIRLVGDLTVMGDARIACTLRGRIKVLGHLEIDPIAVIQGEVRSGSLRIEPGASVKGDLFVGKMTAIPQRGLRKLFAFSR